MAGGAAPKGEGAEAGGAAPNGDGFEVGGAAPNGVDVGGAPLNGEGAEFGVPAPLGGPNGPGFGVELTGGAKGEGLAEGGPKGPGGPGLVGGPWLSKKLLLAGAELNKFDAGDGAFGGWLSCNDILSI